MLKSKIIEFMEALSSSKLHNENGKWLQFSCPLAKWTHERGTDKHPSFGIYSSPGYPSVYQCFSCTHEAMSLLSLVMAFWKFTGRYPLKAAKILFENEVMRNEEPEEKKPISNFDRWSKREVEVHHTLPIEVVERFPLLISGKDEEALEIRNYLVHKRGIELEFIFLNELRYEVERGLIVFPLTDIEGNIKFLQVRRWRDKKLFSISPKGAKMKDVEFPSLREDGPWFGMKHLDISKPVICVEGPLDMLRLQTLGYKNTIASCGASVTKKQLCNIPNNNIMLGYDSDQAGKDATKRIVELLSNRLVQILDWSIVGRKDAGDLTSREELEDVLNNRKIIV